MELEENKPIDDTEDLPNYHDIREEANREEHGEIWSVEHDIFTNIVNIVYRATLLPNDYCQVPIFASFAMLPLPVLNIAPIMWVQGRSGSGKSQLVAVMKFLNRHNAVVFADSTAVALRNTIMQGRYAFHNPELPERDWIERPYTLVVDNAPHDFLKADGRMLSLLLSGVSRRYDRQRISGEKSGTIMEFRTFCPKLISTCFPINNEEAKRRCLVLRTERSEDTGVLDLIDLTALDYDWTEHLFNYWDREKLVEFRARMREFPRSKFEGGKNRYPYFKGVYSIMRMHGFDDPIDVINEFENLDINKGQDSGLQQIIELFLGQLGQPREVSTPLLMKYIRSRVRQEEVDMPSAKEVAVVMVSLGYTEKWDKGGSSWVK
ncbi:hypothetical protein [Roseofilum casamattae]|uniref:Uncharacterized protein n=1 Tax=Roseofilum casamattae BLCC-M143 TaxID=3022442 RepID=A0ABT7C4K6_9CYAN|nr:hypothetical protein [Roseofilum casamattae]MDJ1185826.1 hypothetical protein [Roseofilum casamattae BLCC-M143]